MLSSLAPSTVVGLLGLSFTLGIGLIPMAQAQIIPDETLGSESSTIHPALIQGSPGQLIEGGASRGASLFHSFAEFSIDEGDRAYFANPDGIATIFSRVTGLGESQILGTLGVEGSANLFLLNPHGILFGPQARLDLGGSFGASTADRWIFPDGQEFSATDPQAAPLLTIQPGTDWLGHPGADTGYRGAITQEGILAVGTGQLLRLEGNQVTVTGTLAAPGGTVEVLGTDVRLGATARVAVSGPDRGGTVRIGGDYQGGGLLPQAQRVTVEPGALIEASGIRRGAGGEVILWADRSMDFGGTVLAQGGSDGGDGGFVEVSGLETLDFTGTVDTTAPHGATGTLLLDPDIIAIVGSGGLTPALQDGIWSATEDPGIRVLGPNIIQRLLSNNNLRLEATQGIAIATNVVLNSPHDLTLQAPQIVNFFPNIFMSQLGGGDLILNAPLAADGSGGTIRFVGAQGIYNLLAAGQTGSTGNISLTAARSVEFLGGSQLNATTLGTGNGGLIEVTAPLIKFSGVSNGGIASGARSEIAATGVGNSGGIVLQSQDRIEISQGAILSTNNRGVGQAGLMSLTTRQLEISGESRLGSGVPSLLTANLAQNARGSSAGISLNASESLKILHGAQVTSDSDGQGSAGSITIHTPNLLIQGSSSLGSPTGMSSSIGRSGVGTSGTITITTPSNGQVQILDGGVIHSVNQGAFHLGDEYKYSPDLR